MARALTSLRQVKDGSTQGVLGVSGPPGIGKTALVAEICRRSRALGFRQARSTWDDDIASIGRVGPLISLLRSGDDPMVGSEDYDRALRSVQDPSAAADLVATHLRTAAVAHPVIVAIDNVDRADHVSRAVLTAIVSRLADVPILWVLAGRDFLHLASAEVDVIELGPLTDADIREIGRDRLGSESAERVSALLAAADGNPSFAVELADALAWKVADLAGGATPLEFDAAIAARVAPLSEPATLLVSLVALSERPLAITDLVTGLHPASVAPAVAEAVGAGLVSSDNRHVYFRHDLVRQAVRSGLTEHRRSELDLLLAWHYLASRRPGSAAPHALAARPTIVGVDDVRLACAEALLGVSAADAGVLAAAAFNAAAIVRSDWIEFGRRCLAVLGKAQRVADAIDVAELLLARIDDPEVAGSVQVAAAGALRLAGRSDEIAHRVDRALVRGGLSGATATQLRSARALASSRLEAGPVAMRISAAALQAARQSGDTEALRLAFHASGLAARNAGDHAASLRHFQEMRVLTSPPFSAEEVTALQLLDRYDEAQHFLDVCGAADRFTGTLPELRWAQMWQEFHLGRLQAADSRAADILRASDDIGAALHAVDAVMVRMGVALLRGDFDGAAACFQGAERWINPDDGQPGNQVMRGWLAASRSEWHDAIALLRPVLAGAGSAGGASSRWSLLPCWVGLSHDIGRSARDQDLAMAAVHSAERTASLNPGVASFEGVALVLRALTADSVQDLRHAVAVIERSPRPLLRGWGHEMLGRRLMDVHRAEGLRELDLAWDQYHEMGAIARRADVQRSMREAGARRRKWVATSPQPTAGWFALTDAERKVAGLIGAGQTNRAAAIELGISPNTVGTHLRAVFAKLGIQSRVQLANRIDHEATE